MFIVKIKKKKGFRESVPYDSGPYFQSINEEI